MNCIKENLLRLTFVFVLFFVQGVGSGTQPVVKIRSVVRVFDNGEHNAFTDLVHFQGKYYLTFRSCPDGHMVHPTSSIIILQSENTKDWKQVFRFNVEKRDTRDPHFLVFNERLFVYTGTWYCGESSPPSDQRDLNEHLGFGVWSADGLNWNGPVMLEGTYGHYIWRAASHDGVAYLCGRRKHHFAEVPRSDRSVIESAMLESDDGLVWKTRSLFQETNGDETAFLFEQDGSVLGVSRRGRDNAELVRSNPPYKKWERTDLGRYIGGPLLVNWGDNYLVGGRKIADGKSTTCLYWLVKNELVEFAEFPSDGDNSYPGFVQLSATKALVSYYSSHEKDENGNTITAIYLAKLELE